MANKTCGVLTGSGLTVQYHKKPNMIGVAIRNPLLFEKLMKVNKVQKNKRDCEVTPCEALSSNHVWGDIYLRGLNVKEAPETLVEGLDCNTHRNVAASSTGQKETTILLTFKGKTIAIYVKFLYEAIRVSE